MRLALSKDIRNLDEYLTSAEGVPMRSLIMRSGEAVSRRIRQRVSEGSKIVVLAGKGNNGADGYAAAILLSADYDVKVFDVFSSGQNSEAGRAIYDEFAQNGGIIENLTLNDRTIAEIKNADCIVDAVFGTGFKGEYPEIVCLLAKMVNESVNNYRVAIDVPMGVNADNGSVNVNAVATVTETVALSLVKPGLVSYPAKAYVGELIHDSIGISPEQINSVIPDQYNLIDSLLAKTLLPKREENSSKGNFGKALLYTGSKKYRGAAHLSVEACLRGGVGYVNYMGEADLCSDLCAKYPEVIYNAMPDTDDLSEDDINEIVAKSEKCSATLIGSGSGATEALAKLVFRLLECDGGALILDADAINAISSDADFAREKIKNARRRVVLTPHPLEFSRISGYDVSYVQMHRIEVATWFAQQTNSILVLKGAATVVTDSDKVYVNSSGSSALAKAGSGDVLAGLIASLSAYAVDPIGACASAVYYHGLAADALADSLSVYGVIPSDLPRECARVIASLIK